MFQLDETGRFLYTKYGKSEEGVQTLGEKIIHGIHRFLEILEIVLAAIIVLVLVALMGIEIWELARDPSVFLAEGFLDSFLSSITSLVVAVEFVKMLLRPTVGNTLELLIMALSRYVVLNHHEPLSLAVGHCGRRGAVCHAALPERPPRRAERTIASARSLRNEAKVQKLSAQNAAALRCCGVSLSEKPKGLF